MFVRKEMLSYFMCVIFVFIERSLVLGDCVIDLVGVVEIDGVVCWFL